MRKSRFSEEQIIGILKEHQAGIGAKELCRKHGISDGTFYKWRSKYGGMEVSEAKRLKALEAENAKLKKMLAELGDWGPLQTPSSLSFGTLKCLAPGQHANPCRHRYRGWSSLRSGPRSRAEERIPARRLRTAPSPLRDRARRCKDDIIFVRSNAVPEEVALVPRMTAPHLG